MALGVVVIRAAILGLLVVVNGCAVYGAYANLDKASKDDMQVCYQTIAKAQCGSTTAEASAPGGQGIALPMCMNPLIEDYAATPQASRKTWLVRHGCPKDMVGVD